MQPECAIPHQGGWTRVASQSTTTAGLRLEPFDQIDEHKAPLILGARYLVSITC